MTATINTSGVYSRVNQMVLSRVAVIAANQVGKEKFNKIEHNCKWRCGNRRWHRKSRSASVRLNAKQGRNCPNGLLMMFGRAERRLDHEIYSESLAQFALRLPLKGGHPYKGKTTPLLS